MNEQKYLENSKDTRQEHLDLSENCLLRGGNSTNHRGVLAQYLGTNIFSRPIDLCHACHNGECSNPKHLYWGTRSENVQDARDNGTYKPPFELLVEKYGYDGACEINKQNGSKGWSKGGKAGLGKPKSKSHREKISKSLRNK